MILTLSKGFAVSQHSAICNEPREGKYLGMNMSKDGLFAFLYYNINGKNSIAIRYKLGNVWHKVVFTSRQLTKINQTHKVTFCNVAIEKI